MQGKQRHNIVEFNVKISLKPYHIQP